MQELDNFSIEVLSKNFSVEALDDFKQFKKVLVQQIAYLIKHDFEKLLWILYRIDVSEISVNQILSDKHNLKPAETIADLIIQRQLQKAETRKKFKQKDEGDL